MGYITNATYINAEISEDEVLIKPSKIIFQTVGNSFKGGSIKWLDDEMFKKN